MMLGHYLLDLYRAVLDKLISFTWNYIKHCHESIKGKYFQKSVNCL